MVFIIRYLAVALTTYVGFKQQDMISRGETLIVIPCWWDGTTERYEIDEKKVKRIIGKKDEEKAM